MIDIPKVAVLLAPGINCDRETAYALEVAGASAVRIHVNDIIAGKVALSDFHGLVLPGGFSFGDDIASGKILGNKLKYLLGDVLEQFINSAKPVLGICNGYQVMVKMGLLPGFNREYHTQQLTLTFNTSNKFEDRWVHLKPEHDSVCIFTTGITMPLYLPVRHGEGRLVTNDQKVLAELKNNRQTVLRYVDENGERGGYPVNPNGSEDDIAAICDPSGLVFGLMPHPEAYIRRTQHPRWTSSDLDEAGDGLLIFANMVEHIKEHVL
jgi:phosphoribosylformylglycinamidine synthase